MQGISKNSGNQAKARPVDKSDAMLPTVGQLSKNYVLDNLTLESGSGQSATTKGLTMKAIVKTAPQSAGQIDAAPGLVCRFADATTRAITLGRFKKGADVPVAYFRVISLGIISRESAQKMVKRATFGLL